MLHRAVRGLAAATVAFAAVLGGGSGPIALAAAPAACPTGWSVVPSPSPMGPDGYQQLTGVAAISATDAWAVGWMYTATDPKRDAVTLILRWNGSAWRTAGPRVPGSLSSIAAVSADDIWAVGVASPSGTALTLHWDGRAWRTIANGTGFGDYLQAVSARTHDDVWVAGNAHPGPLSLHWNGSGWTGVPMADIPGVDMTVRAIVAVSAQEAWAAGDYFDITSQRRAFIEHWANGAWSIVTQPVVAGSTDELLTGLTATGPADVWAVGWSRGTSTKTLTEHWNGSSWSIVPSVTRHAVGSNIHLSAAVARSSTDVWAVGAQGSADRTYDTGEPLVKHWSGQRWTLDRSPQPTRAGDVELAAVAAAAQGRLWAVGWVSGYRDSDATTLIMRRCP